MELDIHNIKNMVSRSWSTNFDVIRSTKSNSILENEISRGSNDSMLMDDKNIQKRLNEFQDINRKKIK